MAQALLVIGVARLVLTLAYIRAKNILVSTGAHIINDWASFTFVLVAGIGLGARRLPIRRLLARCHSCIACMCEDRRHDNARECGQLRSGRDGSDVP
ncbi:MAG TPA: hypothetical protein VG369_10180 [Humibacter sp.]|nr:hypothetical protein [Humibacter sp.]